MTRAAWLLAAAAACSQAMPTASDPVHLDASRPSQQLALPDHHGRLTLEVTPTRAGGEGAVTLIVALPGGANPIARFSLYPVDQPARFALRVPADATSLIVTLDRARGSNAALDVRAVAAPK